MGCEFVHIPFFNDRVLTMYVDIYFTLIFNSIFNPTNNLGRLDVLEEVIEDVYHTFINTNEYENIPRIEAIEAFLSRSDVIETVSKDLYFEV